MNVNLKRAAGVVAAAAGLTLALGGSAFASSGAHASSSQFQICSHGSYASYAVFPSTPLPGGAVSISFATLVVAPGHCSPAYTLHPGNTTAKIYGVDSNGKDFLIDTDSFDYTSPDHIVTTGSQNNPDWNATN
ncbi:hypothetical protein ACFZB9_13310 [Kitasatospora sp. NPDC008050]|uniref:hypothetical protein n=1 Tax=Kitasatospora sp. NPDC008050 TaxID=3364021 RepID=UPI0036ED0EB1